MSRRGEMPAEVASLLRFKKELVARRQDHLEKMANGMTRKSYLEHVGRAKEAKFLIEMMDKAIKTWDPEGEG